MKRARRALSGLDDDIREHIELETQENIDRGMSPEEARRQALLKFGNVSLVKEDARGVWAWRRFGELWSTTRIAARTWRRTPVLATAIVVTLALGIGATTAAFTVAYSVLVQRFPFRDPDQLVWVTTYDSRASDGSQAVIGSNRLPQFADWQQHLTAFEQIGAWAGSTPDVFTVSGGQARAELASRQAALSVGKWQWMTVLAQHVTPLPDLVTRTARSPVLLLLGGVGCVLLIACANLGNLLLVRASGRRREIQVRMALGASVGRVLSQMTVESAVLVAAGGTVGVALAVTAIEMLHRVSWLSLPRVGELQIGWPAIAFAAAICAAITFIFGSVALLQLRERDVMDGLRPHPGITTDRRAVSVQRLALAAQVAIVIVLTVAGGLLLRSLTTLVNVDPGFSSGLALAVQSSSALIRLDACRLRPDCGFSIGCSRMSEQCPVSNRRR